MRAATHNADTPAATLVPGRDVTRQQRRLYAGVVLRWRLSLRSRPHGRDAADAGHPCPRFRAAGHGRADQRIRRHRRREATESVTGGTASYTTSTLPVGTDKLTAVFGGGGGYAGSTSAALTFAVKAAPSVSVTNLPATVTGDTATEHPFTVTLTNPSNGLTWTELYVEVTLVGIPNQTKTQAPLQFQDGSGTWCSPIDLSGTATVKGFVVGVTTGCTPSSYPASFSLAAGSPLTIHFRISYPKTGYYGAEKVTATLYTGTCTSATKCTAVAPLTGAVAPAGSATVDVLPSSPLGSKITDIATHQATSPVHQTFDVALESEVSTTKTSGTTGLPAPTGAVSYAIDGTTVATSELPPSTGLDAKTPLALFNTATLAVGKHQLVSTYTPESYTGRFFYSGSTLTETFTVIVAPTGTPFVCAISGLGPATILAYVTATGTVPTTADAGTDVTVTNVTVTLVIDPADDADRVQHESDVQTVLGFSPTGSAATVKRITFTG